MRVLIAVRKGGIKKRTQATVFYNPVLPETADDMAVDEELVDPNSQPSQSGAMAS